MTLPNIPSADVLENDPRNLRIDEYRDGVAYSWNTDQGPDPVLQKAQEFDLNGPVFTDRADYQTLADAVEDDALDEASSFLVVYGQDSSVSWELSDGEDLDNIKVFDEKNEDTELVDAVYQATTGGKLESATIEEVRNALGASQ